MKTTRASDFSAMPSHGMAALVVEDLYACRQRICVWVWDSSRHERGAQGAPHTFVTHSPAAEVACHVSLKVRHKTEKTLWFYRFPTSDDFAANTLLSQSTFVF